ncbi:hypothetical protein PNEG_01039 [Pneumocystis murina B123]|uniref:Uncharacterized protein n=1 Tax=Pneumocystis murina (strain B123) TaxID=1069680 RepID=M7NQA3_PNEMU|nr:hypothetical protein PNEG_01039 [Pneumocystis murina B123]EMR10893.1 hypothetical protein PNEG_01039 [Pneumocystis murina B123]
MNWQIDYNLKDLLRIVTIVCGYLLIRVYLQKWIKSKQARDYETKDNDKSLEKATLHLNTVIENDLEEETLVWGAVRRKEQKMKLVE